MLLCCYYDTVCRYLDMLPCPFVLWLLGGQVVGLLRCYVAMFFSRYVCCGALMLNCHAVMLLCCQADMLLCYVVVLF